MSEDLELRRLAIEVEAALDRWDAAKFAAGQAQAKYNNAHAKLLKAMLATKGRGRIVVNDVMYTAIEDQYGVDPPELIRQPYVTVLP